MFGDSLADLLFAQNVAADVRQAKQAELDKLEQELARRQESAAEEQKQSIELKKLIATQKKYKNIKFFGVQARSVQLAHHARAVQRSAKSCVTSPKCARRSVS